MKNGLPQGWSESKVGEIAEDINYGFTAKASASPIGPKLLRITDLQNGSVQWESVPYCKIPKDKVQNYILRNGDIVFARTGATTGKSFLIKTCPEAVFASYLIRVRPSSRVLSEFVAYYFQSREYWNQISENVSGSAQPNCNATKLASLTMPIPPINEQQRIVAKLEKLLVKVNDSQKRLKKVEIILRRFRQSVLAAACSGQLTADLRTMNDIPISKWIETTLGDIGSWSSGGTPSRRRSEFFGKGIPWVKSGDLPDGPILHTDEEITKQGLKNSSAKLMPTGTISMALYGATIGKLGVMTFPAATNQACANVIPNKDMIDSKFLFLYLFSERRNLIDKGQGGAQPNISQEIVRSHPISLPSLIEQQQIVRRVDELFDLASQIEAGYAKAKAQVDKMTQSILAEAFRGKL